MNVQCAVVVEYRINISEGLSRFDSGGSQFIFLSVVKLFVVDKECTMRIVWNMPQPARQGMQVLLLVAYNFKLIYF